MVDARSIIPVMESKCQAGRDLLLLRRRMRPVTREQTIVELPPAVLFDMDGTLTEPMLDFPRIKAEMGIPPDRPIIEALAEMSGPQRAAAEQVLHRHEEQAATRSKLNPGCRELLAWLTDRGIRFALITRNSERSVRTVVERHA